MNCGYEMQLEFMVGASQSPRVMEASASVLKCPYAQIPVSLPSKPSRGPSDPVRGSCGPMDHLPLMGSPLKNIVAVWRKRVAVLSSENASHRPVLMASAVAIPLRGM